MISKTLSRKCIAACVAVAVLSVYSMVVLASPGASAPSGELSISGQVTVNGQKIYSKKQTGEFPDPAAILKAVKAKL